MTGFGTALSSGYGPGGLRAWKRQGAGNPTYFVYDGADPVLETDGGGSVTALNTFGPTGLLARAPPSMPMTRGRRATLSKVVTQLETHYGPPLKWQFAVGASLLALATGDLRCLRLPLGATTHAGPLVAAHALRPCPAALGIVWRTSSPLQAVTEAGRPVDLAAQHGWRVIYFWSGTCPCVKACERYSFVPLARKYRGRVAFYAVASDGYDLHQPPGVLSAQIKARRLPYPVLLDTAHAIARALHARVTPQTFVLGPAGRVVFRGMPDDSRRFLSTDGPARVAHTYLSVALAQATAGRPVAPAISPLPEAGCVIAW